MEGHTTLLITAEQMGLLPEYMTLARLLQPTFGGELLLEVFGRLASPLDQCRSKPGKEGVEADESGVVRSRLDTASGAGSDH